MDFSVFFCPQVFTAVFEAWVIVFFFFVLFFLQRFGTFFYFSRLMALLRRLQRRSSSSESECDQSATCRPSTPSHSTLYPPPLFFFCTCTYS